MKKLSPVLLALVAVALTLLVFQSETREATAKPPVSPPSPPKKPTVSKFVSNGSYAMVDWYDGSTSGNVYVSTSGTGQNTETHLSYWVYYIQDGSWELVQAGWGYIPRQDFGPNFKLRTDTSAIPGFNLLYGSGGVIDVDWEPIKDIGGRQTGSYQYRNLDFRYRSNGHSEWSRASAQGDVIGLPIAGGTWAETGKNHSVTIEMWWDH